MLSDFKLNSVATPDAGNATVRYTIHEGDITTADELNDLGVMAARTRYRRSGVVQSGMMFSDVSLSEEDVDEVLRHILHRDGPHPAIEEQERRDSTLPTRLHDARDSARNG